MARQNPFENSSPSFAKGVVVYYWRRTFDTQLLP